jgi:hypothetical protein
MLITVTLQMNLFTVVEPNPITVKGITQTAIACYGGVATM